MGRPRIHAVEAGQQFGRWTVTDPDTRKGNEPAAACLCDCGTTGVVTLGHLARGWSKSCGCLRIDRLQSAETRASVVRAATTHGVSGNPLYGVWVGMMARCYRPDHDSYKHYGGRGVTVSPEWHSVQAFVAWIEANIGPRPDGQTANGHTLYTLDRIDGDGNYEPGNVQWSDWVAQAQNRKGGRSR